MTFISQRVITYNFTRDFSEGSISATGSCRDLSPSVRMLYDEGGIDFFVTAVQNGAQQVGRCLNGFPSEATGGSEPIMHENRRGARVQSVRVFSGQDCQVATLLFEFQPLAVSRYLNVQAVRNGQLFVRKPFAVNGHSSPKFLRKFRTQEALRRLSDRRGRQSHFGRSAYGPVR